MHRDSSPPEADCTALLTDQTRRQICAILMTPDPPLAVRDLAAELAARLLDVPPREVSAEQRRKRVIQLHHHQLPKLADHGLIEYSRSCHTIRLTTAGIETLTAATDSHPPSSRLAAAPQCDD